MGDAFKPPRRHQAVQWRNVEMLRRAGHVFRHNTGPWPLKTLRHAREALSPRRPDRGASVLEKVDGSR
ncbi:MAG: hypothetical protein JOZ41_00385 [Chloroflexi bacterium]|nr:hypothetical protein [Chloroflexota bacterium]